MHIIVAVFLFPLVGGNGKIVDVNLTQRSKKLIFYFRNGRTRNLNCPLHSNFKNYQKLFGNNFR